MMSQETKSLNATPKSEPKDEATAEAAGPTAGPVELTAMVNYNPSASWIRANKDQVENLLNELVLTPLNDRLKF